MKLTGALQSQSVVSKVPEEKKKFNSQMSAKKFQIHLTMSTVNWYVKQ
jgi:hypothetical protein